MPTAGGVGRWLRRPTPLASYRGSIRIGLHHLEDLGSVLRRRPGGVRSFEHEPNAVDVQDPQQAVVTGLVAPVVRLTGGEGPASDLALVAVGEIGGCRELHLLPGVPVEGHVGRRRRVTRLVCHGGDEIIHPRPHRWVEERAAPMARIGEDVVHDPRVQVRVGSADHPSKEALVTARNPDGDAVRRVEVGIDRAEDIRPGLQSAFGQRWDGRRGRNRRRSGSGCRLGVVARQGVDPDHDPHDHDRGNQGEHGGLLPPDAPALVSMLPFERPRVRLNLLRGHSEHLLHFRHPALLPGLGGPGDPCLPGPVPWTDARAGCAPPARPDTRAGPRAGGRPADAG